MIKHVAAVAAGLTLCVSAGQARAADIDYVTGAAVLGCQTVGGPFDPTGQTFTVPAGETLMTSVTLALTGFPLNTAGSTLTLYPITGSTLGAPIASTSFTATGVTFPSYSLQTLTLPAGGLSVTPGQTYAILSSVAAGSNHCLPVQGPVYADGSAYQTANGPLLAARDGIFSVDFGPPPPPPIPTMSEWAMILFSLILAGAAALLVQRRHLA